MAEMVRDSCDMVLIKMTNLPFYFRGLQSSAVNNIHYLVQWTPLCARVTYVNVFMLQSSTMHMRVIMPQYIAQYKLVILT